MEPEDDNLAPKDEILISKFDDLVHKLMKTWNQKRDNLAMKGYNLAP